VARKRVAVTGVGLVNPFGSGDTDDFFARILAGESCIRHYVTDDIPRPLSLPAVMCAGFDADVALGRPLASTMDRFAQLGMAAAFAAADALAPVHGTFDVRESVETHFVGFLVWAPPLDRLGVKLTMRLWRRARRARTRRRAAPRR